MLHSIDHARDQSLEEWQNLERGINTRAIEQWHSRLTANVRNGGPFEQNL